MSTISGWKNTIKKVNTSINRFQYICWAKAFLHYVDNKDMPEWENENTLAKYYITTTAVEMAKIGNK